MNIAGKKISILGAVRSGIAAAKLAKAKGALPFVSDMAIRDKIEDHLSVLEVEGIKFETGGHSALVYDCDFIIASPGVPSHAKVLVDAKEKGIPVYSEIEFASWFCKGNIIAITGTNGKTTTTALCAYLLNECGLKAYAAGNIGLAFSEVAAQVKHDEFVALEVSSFQLDYIKSFKPMFAMILNITPDHLDRYENNFEKYTAAKMRIAENQSEGNYFIVNEDDKAIPKNIINDKIDLLTFSLIKKVEKGTFYKDGSIFYSHDGKSEEICSSDVLTIKGEHNIANALAVVSVAKTLGLPNAKIKKALNGFPGVEHRLEMVRELNGIEFINDSKATNVDSVWYALKSFDKPVYLILGGKDKGNDYNIIKELVIKNVKKIYAVGESAQKVVDFFGKLVSVEKMETLEATVEAGLKEAEPGSIVLLSPACASFDMFKDFEHRGRVFKDSVNRLKL